MPAVIGTSEKRKRIRAHTEDSEEVKKQVTAGYSLEQRYKDLAHRKKHHHSYVHFSTQKHCRKVRLRASQALALGVPKARNAAQLRRYPPRPRERWAGAESAPGTLALH